MRTRLLFVLAFLAFLLVAAGPAAADTKSWAAVKGKLPADTLAVFGFDAAAIQQTATYQALIAMAMAKDPDVQAGLDAVKAGCGVDALAAVADVTVVMSKAEQPTIVIGFDGLDEKRAVPCLQAAVDHEAKGEVVSAKKRGKLTEYARTGKKKKLYVAWLAPDVLAFTDDIEDKKALAKAVGGRGARGALAPALRKVKVDAPVWFAFARPTPVDPVKGTMNAVYGTIQLQGGSLDGSANLVMATADQATQLSDLIGSEVPGMIQQLEQQKQTDLASFLRTVKAWPADEEVQVTGRMAEATLMTIAKQAGAMFP